MTTTIPTGRRLRVGQPETVVLVVLLLLASGRWIADALDQASVQTWSTIFVAIVVQSVPFLAVGCSCRL